MVRLCNSVKWDNRTLLFFSCWSPTPHLPHPTFGGGTHVERCAFNSPTERAAMVSVFSTRLSTALAQTRTVTVAPYPPRTRFRYYTKQPMERTARNILQRLQCSVSIRAPQRSGTFVLLHIVIIFLFNKSIDHAMNLRVYRRVLTLLSVRCTATDPIDDIITTTIYTYILLLRCVYLLLRRVHTVKRPTMQ